MAALLVKNATMLRQGGPIKRGSLLKNPTTAVLLTHVLGCSTVATGGGRYFFNKAGT
ncbi:MAG: hypothetical protein IID36_09295 [Planctomycetes bacterium]|nr:hypothetical protein [Planctomycetota bacterium]